MYACMHKRSIHLYNISIAFWIALFDVVGSIAIEKSIFSAFFLYIAIMPTSTKVACIYLYNMEVAFWIAMSDVTESITFWIAISDVVESIALWIAMFDEAESIAFWIAMSDVVRIHTNVKEEIPDSTVRVYII